MHCIFPCGRALSAPPHPRALEQYGGPCWGIRVGVLDSWRLGGGCVIVSVTRCVAGCVPGPCCSKVGGLRRAATVLPSIWHLLGLLAGAAHACLVLCTCVGGFGDSAARTGRRQGESAPRGRWVPETSEQYREGVRGAGGPRAVLGIGWGGCCGTTGSPIDSLS
jgi:hypothetical protein